MDNKEKRNILTRNSQRLRKEMTPEEKMLWYKFLKGLPYTVNRQRKIGKYIVDFYCSKGKLVIEIDGSQHYEGDAIEYDRIRDAYLKGLGLRVVRFTNYDVRRNFRGVCQDILDLLSIDEEI